MSTHSTRRCVDVVVIGAGHAGLVMSRHLTERALDHVVLERGAIANSWRRERWESLRLLTPNWQNQLPRAAGDDGAIDDPDGFMTIPTWIERIESYAADIDAPVQTHTTVVSVVPSTNGYRVVTDRGEWLCRALVLASGACSVPNLPALRASVPASIEMLTPMQYRNPQQLDQGGVLVVGASATGVQLADEIQRSGRQVTLAIGEHVRMPRTYRGRDIQWWMSAAGILDERFDAIEDIARARRVPSAQLIGTPQRRTLDLNVLSDLGVRCVGRLAGIAEGRAQFSGALRNHCAMADLKLQRLLDRIDAWAQRSGMCDDALPAERFSPTHIRSAPCLGASLTNGNIRTIIWATGYRPDYSWLHVPVLDRKGQLRHRGGIVDAPGLYALGLPFMRRRKSSFIHGANDDAKELSAHLAGYLTDKAPRRGGIAGVFGHWSSSARSESVANVHAELARLGQ